jgi:hypothetical protein
MQEGVFLLRCISIIIAHCLQQGLPMPHAFPVLGEPTQCLYCSWGGSSEVLELLDGALDAKLRSETRKGGGGGGVLLIPSQQQSPFSVA